MKTFSTRFSKFGLVAIAIAGLASCKKDKDEEKAPAQVSAGVYVLNEGNFQTANSTISYYQYADASKIVDVFSAFNSGSKLGDTGQDIQTYGSKTYVSVNGSNKVEVLDTKSSKITKTIVLTASSEAQAVPRYLAAASGKVFLTAFDDNVYVIDTTSLSVIKKIKVGIDPEGLAVVGSKLYVANSGGFTFEDKTVSVIDIPTLAETKKIMVGVNLGQVAADKYGDVYVVSRGNYGDIKPTLYKINTINDQVSDLNVVVTGLAIKGDVAYAYKSSYSFATNSYDKGYFTINVKDETTGSSFIKDGTDASIIMPYGIGVDPVNGDVYVADAKNFQRAGEVFCFTAEGKLKFKFDSGVNPSRFAFYIK